MKGSNRKPVAMKRKGMMKYCSLIMKSRSWPKN